MDTHNHYFFIVAHPNFIAVPIGTEYATNFHKFYEERKDPTQYTGAHNALYNMKVLNRNGSISEQEWDVSRMYVAVKFRKVRESSIEIGDGDIGSDEMADP